MMSLRSTTTKDKINLGQSQRTANIEEVLCSLKQADWIVLSTEHRYIELFLNSTASGAAEMSEFHSFCF